MKALILNDTYDCYHWGCNATSKVISLLYIAYVSKRFLRKNVQIINHSSSPISDRKNSKLVNTIYKGVYKTMDFIAIREHISQ